jgi:3-oxoacyl-[acyl-carrier-protein] synthase-3
MIGIKSLGKYLPEENIPIEQLLPDLREDQKAKLGIKHSLHETKYSATEMAVLAAKNALKKGAVDALEIDLIISCQAGLPDYLVWQTAGKIQEELKASKAEFVDLYQGCCGFIAGMRMARNTLMAEKNIRNVLVCSGEKWQNVIEKRVVGGYVFSDGASAVVISKESPNNHIKGFGVIGRGDFANISKMQAGRIKGLGLKNPKDGFYNLTNENPDGIEELKSKNIQYYIDAANSSLKEAGYTMKEIDFIIFPNGRRDFTNKLINAFEISKQRTNYKYIEKTGDISTADAMINYQRLLEDGSFKKGQKILVLSQGAGMTWAATVIKV